MLILSRISEILGALHLAQLSLNLHSRSKAWGLRVLAFQISLHPLTGVTTLKKVCCRVPDQVLGCLHVQLQACQNDRVHRFTLQNNAIVDLRRGRMMIKRFVQAAKARAWNCKEFVQA